MTKGTKCDGPDCNEFCIGDPSGIDRKWYQVSQLAGGNYSYHFHNIDCLINWAKLVKGDEDEVPELPPSDEGELLEMNDPGT